MELSEEFECICAHYVLLSWVHDLFREIPYLRIRGDFGTEKTRFLQTIGSLCYRPIFASGSSTISPIFHLLDRFGGTFVFDEADFRFSDENQTSLKSSIMATAKGFPVLRSVSQNGHSFAPQAFNVFGPKVIATRQVFQDAALKVAALQSSRARNGSGPIFPLHCLRISTPKPLISEICYCGTDLTTSTASVTDRYILIPPLDPRIQQIMQPLMRVAESERSSQIIADHATQMSQELSQDRGWQIEAEILRVIRDLWSDPASTLSVSAITSEFAKRANEGFEVRINNRWMGHQLRKVLGLSTHKSRGVFVLSPQNAAKLEVLYKKFGLDPS